ncbi:hypothetical protein B2A_13606, partial [mine drainage metagenome]
PISGGVLHTVNIRYSPELIFYTMQHANDRFVIIRDEFVPLVEKSVGLLNLLKNGSSVAIQGRPQQFFQIQLP